MRPQTGAVHFPTTGETPLSENRVAFSQNAFGLRQQFVRGFISQETYRTEIADRNAEWSRLSPTEQLASLDRRLGVGIGARRQRVKLAALLTNPTQTATLLPVPTEQFASKSEEKRIKALRAGRKHKDK
jgi:hypothetical protein